MGSDRQRGHKDELRAAVAVIDELVPPGDAELNGQRLEELAGRLATVRPFLPLMMRTIEFGATADGTPVLKAMMTLADLLTTKSKLPATYLDARRIDHDLITGGWSRLVYWEGRPPETVDRAAYTLCVLEQFHRHLKHRNIFALTSLHWRDPRAHLLSGEVWEQARDAGMNALDLPVEPGPLRPSTRPGWTTCTARSPPGWKPTPRPLPTRTASCMSAPWSWSPTRRR